MKRKNVNTGDKYGRLAVISEIEPNHTSDGHPIRMVKCKCNCGAIIDVRASFLFSGHTKSCGCLRRDTTKDMSTIHGMKNTKIYRCWQSIKTRCENANFNRYEDYGGRGIKICRRWANSFEAFYKDMGNPPSHEHSIDRIDNNGNYEPGNCRWATRYEQAQNCRIKITNKTGVKGVYFNKMCAKWGATICDYGKPIYLGISPDFFEACCLRKSAENNYGYSANQKGGEILS